MKPSEKHSNVYLKLFVSIINIGNSDIKNSNETLHIYHNHVEAYKDAGKTNIATCLSIGDIGKLATNKGDETNFFYPYGSITADCKNGSRMSLVITDWRKFHKACTTKINGKTLLKIASENLHNNYHNNIVKSTNKHIRQSLDEWLNRKLIDARKQNKNTNKTEMLKEYKLHMLRIEKNYYKNNFKKDISENIKEFKELGLKLTVGWVRSNE